MRQLPADSQAQALCTQPPFLPAGEAGASASYTPSEAGWQPHTEQSHGGYTEGHGKKFPTGARDRQSSSAILMPRTVTATIAVHLKASLKSEFTQTEAKIGHHMEAKSTRI